MGHGDKKAEIQGEVPFVLSSFVAFPAVNANRSITVNIDHLVISIVLFICNSCPGYTDKVMSILRW